MPKRKWIFNEELGHTRVVFSGQKRIAVAIKFNISYNL